MPGKALLKEVDEILNQIEQVGLQSPARTLAETVLQLRSRVKLHSIRLYNAKNVRQGSYR
jgi:hypothetical protein